MKKVILMRGPSGAGKSTYIKENFPNARVCSADNFFMKSEVIDGEATDVYDFDPTKIGEAHAWCMNKFIQALSNGCKNQTIVVDNTLIHLWECQNYVDTALMMGYEVEIIEIEIVTVEGLRTCIRRNAHNVPKEVVCKMVTDFQFFVDVHDGSVRRNITIRHFEDPLEFKDGKCLNTETLRRCEGTD
jgi:predicted kinase